VMHPESSARQAVPGIALSTGLAAQDRCDESR